MASHMTVMPASAAARPRASQEWDLPVLDGPQTDRFSRQATHSGALSASWTGRGTEDAASSADGILGEGGISDLHAGRAEVISESQGCQVAVGVMQTGRLASGNWCVMLYRSETRSRC